MRNICTVFLFFLQVVLNASFNPNNRYWLYGEIYFSRKEYNPAIECYKRIAHKKDYKTKALYRIIECYRATNNSQDAVAHTHLLLKEKNIPADSVLFLCAQVFKDIGQYANAQKLFLDLAKKHPANNSYLQSYNSCDSARHWMTKPENIKIENLKITNTEFSELSPQLYNDSLLIFSSNREHMIIRKKNNFSGEPFFDLYSVVLNVSIPPKVKPFHPVLNTIHHEFAPAFSPSGDTIFFTKSMDQNISGKDSINRLKLFCSVRSNNKNWSEAQMFFLNKSLSSFAHPYIDPSGRMFFFASNMEGGYGNSDIYVCFRKDTLWSKPVNLGPVINSDQNETYPFYYNGSLYFSSDRNSGMGGFDIYKSIQKKGEWVLSQNMKFPLNTSFDDISFIITPDGKTAYLSSNRPGGEGKEDLYKVTLQE